MEYLTYLKKIEYFKSADLRFGFDSLTKVLERKVMIDYINYLTRNGTPFSLFLIDVDNFKNVNDTYGHLVGDAVLAQTAEYFAEKASDLGGVVARYGGDEFLIVFEGVTDYGTVWQYGNEIDINTGSLTLSGTPNLTVTASIGISRSPLDATGYEELLTVSDKALYRAKMKGRNCFIIYSPEKHANILVKERDKRLTSMQLVANMFSNLMASGEDVSAAINTVFRSLVSNFMYDHICIETNKGLNFSVCCSLAKNHDFSHIDYDLISKNLNSIGYKSFKFKGQSDGNSYGGLFEQCKKQGISSALYCRIFAYGKEYGVIRIDSLNTVRIWQNSEISIVMVAANAIGLLLHYQNKTLEELPEAERTSVGETE